MNIFVIHYTPLIERKKHIQRLFKKLDLKPEFITKYDRDKLMELEGNYTFNKNKWNKEISLIKI